MHNNYYFIRQIAIELNTILPGSKLIEIFSQNKDEAIINFGNYAGKFTEHYLIAHLTGRFTCLAFPTDYAKAKKNAASLFTPLQDKEVIEVGGFVNERAFYIEFTEKFKLIFKLFGRQSNLILLKDNEVIEIFRKTYMADRELREEQLHRKIDQGKQALIDALPNYRKIFPTLHKDMINHIDHQLSGKSQEDAAETILSIINQYKHPKGYVITEKSELPALEIVITDDRRLIKSPSEAITKFFFTYHKSSRLIETKRTLLKEIDQKIGKTEVYISKTKRKLISLRDETNHRNIADVIMANLDKIPRNKTRITLPSFYSSEDLTIKLNPELSPQQNAERYYKKAKNLNLEIDNLNKSILAKENLLKSLKKDRSLIEDSSDIKSLKKFTNIRESHAKVKEHPFREFTVGKFKVYVGKSAKQNDVLTLKYAKKDDLFFHAKDVGGSHVILKMIPGQPVPASVLETTAAIAAYYSKRKTDTLCPVGYTEKKYVRKPKKSAPGLVIVEREKVVLVPPGLPDDSSTH